jgi:hypothetical protein
MTSSSNTGTHPVRKATGPNGVTKPPFESRVSFSMIARQRNAAAVTSQVRALVAKAIASLAITNPPLVMGRTAM